MGEVRGKLTKYSLGAKTNSSGIHLWRCGLHLFIDSVDSARGELLSLGWCQFLKLVPRLQAADGCQASEVNSALE